MPVQVKKSRDGYTVIVKAIGPREEVSQFIEDYMREYPPQGYGTWIESSRELPENHFEATIRRNSSCD